MRALIHSNAMRQIVDQTNASTCKRQSRSIMDEKDQEELMTRMNVMETSAIPGQSAGATTNAQMHDMNPQVRGCIRWWVDDAKRVDGTTGNGAATG